MKELANFTLLSLSLPSIQTNLKFWMFLVIDFDQYTRLWTPKLLGKR